MIKLSTLVKFALLFAITGGTARAAIEQLSTTFLTKLEDNDYELLIKGTGNTTANVVEKGDFLLSIAEFPDFKNAALNTNYASFDTTTTMLTGIGFAKVFDVTGAGTGSASFVFIPASSAEWTAAGLTAPSGTGTIFKFFDDPVGTHLPGVTGLTTASGLADVTGTLLYEFGFTGLGGASVGGQFFVASTSDSLPIVGFPPRDAANIKQIDALNGFAALDVTFGNTNAFAGHDFLLLGAGLHQLELVASLGSGPTLPPGSFDIHTDTDAYIMYQAPEPTSIVAWGLLAASSTIYLRRRKNS